MSTGHVQPILISFRDVQAIVGLGKSTIYRMMKDGEFPRPCHKLSLRHAQWDRAEVEQWALERTKRQS